MLEPQVPYPSNLYMEYINGADTDQLASFKRIGPELVGRLEEQGLLESGTRFLDIGCGCGRLARHLLDRPLAGYTGFDRHPGMVAWCKANIEPLKDNFQFHHFALKSSYELWDGKIGSIDAKSFVFPFDDNSFDTVFLASVFTHMPIDETGNYLRQMHRVLSPKGKAMFSVFHADQPAVCDNINFYYPQKQFLDLFAETGFESRFLYTVGTDKNYLHQYYLLEKQA